MEPVASCQNLEIPVSGQAQNSSSHLIRVSRLSHSPVLAPLKLELDTPNSGIYDEREVLSCCAVRWHESTRTLVTSHDLEFHSKIPKIITLGVLLIYNLGSCS